MELESLATNVFFNTLRGSHEDVWHSVARNGWLLCVPQSCSLRGRVTRRDIETHVLQPSRAFPGEFVTLNGKFVVIVGTEIQTKSGFAE